MKPQDDDFCAAPVWMSEDKHQIQASSASDWALDVHATARLVRWKLCVIFDGLGSMSCTILLAHDRAARSVGFSLNPTWLHCKAGRIKTKLDRRCTWYEVSRWWFLCRSSLNVSEDKHQIQASSASDWELDVHATARLVRWKLCVIFDGLGSMSCTILLAHDRAARPVGFSLNPAWLQGR